MGPSTITITSTMWLYEKLCEKAHVAVAVAPAVPQWWSTLLLPASVAVAVFMVFACTMLVLIYYTTVSGFRAMRRDATRRARGVRKAREEVIGARDRVYRSILTGFRVTQRRVRTVHRACVQVLTVRDEVVDIVQNHMELLEGDGRWTLQDGRFWRKDTAAAATVTPSVSDGDTTSCCGGSTTS